MTSDTSHGLSLFAVAAPGLAPVVGRELRALGMDGLVEEAGGVGFRGGVREVWSANLHLRTASRVLVRVAQFRATAFHELERGAKRIPWADMLASGQPTRLRVTCRKSRLYHSDAVAQRIADAIRRVANVEIDSDAGMDEEESSMGGAQLFVVRVHHDRVTVSADSSGELLHRRGYRQAGGKAPLRETLAAALLMESGWTPARPLVDPFCGSGTIVIEAGQVALGIAPGLARAERDAFAFARWPTFDAAAWSELVGAARAQVVATAPAPLLGSDRDEGVIEAARANAARAGVAGAVSFEVRPATAAEAPPARGFVVTNPPYGVRVGEVDGLRNLYEAWGRSLRARFGGWRAAFLSASPQLETRLGLSLASRLATNNGGIPVRVVSALVP